DVLKDARELVATITENDAGVLSNNWHVVIVTQTEGWTEGAFQTMGGTSGPPNHEVRSISTHDVRAALQSSPRLAWAASHDEIIAVLGNLRTLAWVLEAESRFQPQDVQALASPMTIADHLWRYWTGGKLKLRNMLIRFAEREANFEHSFPISELDPADAAAMDERPAQAPMRVNARNCIEFQHDMAAEWARYQRLKEIADRPEQWARYAGRPLWLGGLRMLGGLLLRENANGRSAWDIAFEELERQQETLTVDILLDTL